MKQYKIETCRDKDDFDNDCYIPSNGGVYNKVDAISKLENSNGGIIIDQDGNRYTVNYDKSKNGWLKDI